MPAPPRVLRVFLSSPGDVSEERALAERVLKRLGEEYRERLRLVLVLWEHEPLFAHAGFQEQIERPSQCDLVLIMLWSRLGTRLPANFAVSPGEAPPTGTAFEVQDALESYRRLGRPHLLIYRRTAPPHVNLASADVEERLTQYRMLQDFCRRAFYDEQGAVMVAHHEYAESWEFERRLTEHVRKWLEREMGETSRVPRWTQGSPYRGLQSFEAEHREIYFGRSQAVSELVQHLRALEERAEESATRFLLVQGMSGNGKSSLVRAGLLPLLQGRAVEGIGAWRQVIVKPSDQGTEAPGVFGALAEQLLAALPPLRAAYTAVTLADRLRTAPRESAARLEGYLNEEAGRMGLSARQIRLVIFVDQLEETWSPAIAAEERQALAGCVAALAREGRTWVIATLRSDFAANFESVAEYSSLLKGGRLYVLAAPRGDELGEMIRDPAAAAGLEWESKDGVSLDQAIQREASVSPESLPLLEYALDQLYERRDGRRLTYAAYDALGRLAGGVAASAEAVLKEQGPVEPALAKLLRSLVSVDENGQATRRYARLSEIPEGSPERGLLTRLIERRLCVTDNRGQGAEVSLAHEALLRSWPRLTDWLREENSLLQARELAQRDARLWLEHAKSNAWLASADKVVTFMPLETAEIALPPAVREFIERSRRNVRRSARIKQAAVAMIALLAVAASIGAWVASRQKREAERHAAAAREAQLQLLTEAAAERLKDGDLIFARGIVLEVLKRRVASHALDPAAMTVLQEIRASDPAMVIMAHSDSVRRLAYSPDGTRIVTAGYDGTAAIWDSRTGIQLQLLKVHPHVPGSAVYSDIVKTAVYSPDATRVLTADAGGVVRVWDPETGAPVRIIVEHLKDLQSARYSPDGARIVSAAGPNVQIWDGQTGALLAHFTGPDEGFNTAAFSPDGSRVVAASVGGAVPVWDARSGRQMLTLTGHKGGVMSAVYSPDGARILTASNDSTVRVWDAHTGEQLIVISASLAEAPVWYAEFSPDGKTIATATTDKAVRVWDAATGQHLKLFSGHVDIATGVAYSPDGRYLASSGADKTARTWKLEEGVDAQVISRDIDSVNFAPDGTRILTTLSDGKTARTWDAMTGTPIASFSDPDGEGGALYSPDGRKFLTAPYKKGIRIWDAATGERLVSFPSPSDDSDAGTATYSPDGTRVLASYDDFTFDTHDARTGALLHAVRQAHENFITSAVYSPDATRILTASVDRTVRIWDAQTYTQLRVLQHKDFVNEAVYSPNGELIVAGTNDSFAHVWNAQTGTELRVLAGHHAPVTCMAFSPDGSRIATGSRDRTIRIWDTLTGVPLAVLLGNGSMVTAVSYSPDGKRIASVGGDHVAKIWNASVPADWLSQVLWEEALESDPLSDVQRTVLGVPSTLTLLTNRAIGPGEPVANAHDTARSQAPREWARSAERLEREALAESSEKMDAKLLEAFALYARAAEYARREQWPQNEWQPWRYRRSSLARVLAADGLMQEVAKAYASVLNERAP